MKFSNTLICFLIFLGFACTSDGIEPQMTSMMTDPDNTEDSSDENNEDILYKGDFMDDAHPTSGVASVNKGMNVLNFTNFKTDSGPVLEVYLATDREASDYVTLGELKGIEGNFVYDIPNNVDLTTHKYVLIWCVEFSVNFGYAVLE